MQSVRAGDIGKQRGGARARRPSRTPARRLQAERIARQFERDVIVAAERELADGVELALGQVGLELDLAGGEHVGRRGDDDGAGADAALRGLDLDAVAAAPFDPRHRRGELHRQAVGELGEQRAEALPAERVGVALDRRGRNRRPRPPLRSLPQANGPEHEFDRSPASRRGPWAAPASQETSALPRAASAMARWRAPGREKILQLAFARVAPADAHALPGRRRIDVEPGLGREPAPAD